MYLEVSYTFNKQNIHTTKLGTSNISHLKREVLELLPEKMKIDQSFISLNLRLEAGKKLTTRFCIMRSVLVNKQIPK